MKDAENKLNAKPTATPVVYLKDFEKRFDELLVKNKTPRKDTLSTISPRGRDGEVKLRPELDCIA